MAIWGSVLKKMDENTMILIFGEFGSSVYIFCDQVHIQTKKYGEKSLEYFGTLIWNTLPTLIKDSTNIFKFKSLIKLWKSKKCPCYLCKDFVKGIGFVEFCKCTSCHK